MFTGLVADVGTVRAIERSDAGARLRVASPLAAELSPGDSIAVEGCCLTALEPGSGEFSADVMNATLERTTLGDLSPDGRVNCELAVRPADRLGGHLVQGHVDGVGEVTAFRADGVATRLAIALDPGLLRYLVAQGSVTVAGVSLTVAAIDDAGFEVSLIPETRDRTTLGERVAGERVNIEVDVLARYVERLLSGFRAERA